MIIQLRGTSGSGKSTLARRVMELYTGTRLRIKGEPVPGKPRKQPVGYLNSRANPSISGPDMQVRFAPSLFVPGHYETACGGADTITQIDYTFGLVREAVTHGHDVLFEGLLLSADVNKVAALMDLNVPMHAIILNIPLEECLDSVNARRRAKKGDGAPGVNPKNTASKHKGVMSTIDRLAAAGIQPWIFTGPAADAREQAFLKVRELLNV